MPCNLLRKQLNTQQTHLLVWPPVPASKPTVARLVIFVLASAFRSSAFSHLSVLSKDLQLSALSFSTSNCICAMATCEYEVLRQQKIADNRKRMESLGLQKVRAAIDMGSQTSADRRCTPRAISLRSAACHIVYVCSSGCWFVVTKICMSL